MKKLEYFLFCIICISFLCSCSENGRHVDKTTCLLFSSFSKKGSLIVVLVERGKRSILSCNKIIMRNLYNTNLMPTAKSITKRNYVYSKTKH